MNETFNFVFSSGITLRGHIESGRARVTQATSPDGETVGGAGLYAEELISQLENLYAGRAEDEAHTTAPVALQHHGVLKT